MQFDDAMTVVKDHPVETVVIVAGVGVLGYLYFQRKQEKKRQHELELARLRSITPPACNCRHGSRLRRKHRSHELVA
jgi:hypothetical protein